MPIKLMIKLCWMANGIAGMILLATLGLVFGTPSAAPMIKDEINADPPILDGPVVKKKALDEYRDIWVTGINIKAPVVQEVKAGPPEDWFQKLLQQNIRIESIMTKGIAIITMGDQNYDIQELTPQNQNDVSKAWELNVAGQKVIVLKIEPGKGILFKFQGNDGKEVWLIHEQPIFSKPKEKKTAKNNEITSRQLEPNRWEVTAEDGEQILKHSDEYISDLSPAFERGSDGSAIGIRIRRVTENSKAYELGLRANDIVKNINGTPVTGIDNSYVRQMAKKYRNDKQIVVEVVRNGKTIRLTFDIRR